MDQISKISFIEEYELKQDFYFQSLFELICERKLISMNEIEKIQLSLVELLAKEIDRYTNGESSSVPIEKAQDILRSISYCLGVYLKTIPDMQEKIGELAHKDIKAMFYSGMDRITLLKNEAKEVLDWVQNNYIKVNHIALEDTIYVGIPEFFHDYNTEYAADEMAGSIDYQLLHSVEGLIGVEYIQEYLKRLKMENMFLLKFSKYDISGLMKAFHKDCEHMLVNLYELVLTNALGCVISGMEPNKLIMNSKDVTWLTKRLSNQTMEERKEELIKAFDKLVEMYHIPSETINYTKPWLHDLRLRIEKNLENDTLDKIFISYSVQQEDIGILVSETVMEDEDLRNLIVELREINSVSLKLNRVRESVHSMEDWSELVNECFYGEELQELMSLLTNQEKKILMKLLKEEAGMEDLADYTSNMEWKRMFLK